jgi:osmotically-inducible protein OsmY
MKFSNLLIYLSLFLTTQACAKDKNNTMSSSKTNMMAMENSKMPSDSEINQAVTDQIFFDQYFTLNSISILTENGIVELNGTVDNLRSVDRAVNLAESIKGVRSVINQLKVMAAVKTDKALRKDVIKALTLDPTTDAYKLKFSVKEGIVKMTGNVGSYAEKNLAEWAVKGIHGVRSLDNQVTVTLDKKRSDIDIAQDVEGRIRKNPYLADALIKVNVVDGTVKLNGEVGSPATKRRAAIISWVNGVKEVNTDEIKIEPFLKNTLLKKTVFKSDSEIKDAIKDAYFYDPRVFSFNPTVEVKYGEVTLNGSVNSLAAKYAAEEDAHNTTGVFKVVNNLKVDPSIVRSDANIKSDVIEMLKLNLTDSQFKKINIDVKNGSVILTGDVNNPFIKNVAFNAASRINGVKNIESNLTLKNRLSVALNDEKLQKQIEQNMFWNPHLNLGANHIKVKVKNGIANISGNVKTWKQYFQATHEAFWAGAKEVQNDMRINDKQMSSTFKYDTYPVDYLEVITF